MSKRIVKRSDPPVPDQRPFVRLKQAVGGDYIIADAQDWNAPGMPDDVEAWAELVKDTAARVSYDSPEHGYLSLVLFEESKADDE